MDTHRGNAAGATEARRVQGNTNLSPDDVIRLRTVQRRVYLLSMVIAVLVQLVYVTKGFKEGRVIMTYTDIVHQLLALCMLPIGAAIFHNEYEGFFDVYGIGALMWSLVTLVPGPLITASLAVQEFFTQVFIVVVVVGMTVTFFVDCLLDRFRFRWYCEYLLIGVTLILLLPLVAFLGIAMFLSSPLFATMMLTIGFFKWVVIGKMDGDYFVKSDILTRARLGRGSEYTIHYQVASVFYILYSVIAGCVGARLQDTLLKSVVAAFGVLTLPTVLSMGDGPQCFSFTAAMTGVVEVKSVDQLLVMTGTKRKELLKALLNNQAHSDSISRKKLCFARATLTGGLELKQGFTASELKEVGVKICRHVLRYPDGLRFMVSKTDGLLHVHKSQNPDVDEGHDIDACLSAEDADLEVEGTIDSRDRDDRI